MLLVSCNCLLSFVVGTHTREVDGAIVVGIHLVDHVLELRLGRVLTQGPHHGAQFLGGDLTWLIFVSRAPSYTTSMTSWGFMIFGVALTRQGPWKVDCWAISTPVLGRGDHHSPSPSLS